MKEKYMQTTKRERVLCKSMLKVMKRDPEKMWHPADVYQALQYRCPGRFRLTEVQELLGKIRWHHFGLDLKIDVGRHLQRAGQDKTTIATG